MTRPMSEEREKLEPCPFCGGDSIECHPNDIATGGAAMAGASSADLHYTHCNGCGAEGPGAHSYSEAIELHNRRSTSSAERGMREALESIRYHSENQDMSHLTFRIKARECVDHALSSKGEG